MLVPLDSKSRKLEAVRNLWEGIFPYAHIEDVYTKEPVNVNDFDVDHFIPFSFVMNDELWNLMPMDSVLNSGKNNNLPIWDNFFNRFANNQFILYELIYRNNDIFALYKNALRIIFIPFGLHKNYTERTIAKKNL